MVVVGGESPSNTDINNIANPVVGTSIAYSKTDFSTVMADRVMVKYMMKGVKETEVQATSLVFISKTLSPAAGWPIVVWAQGSTTGVAEICAPTVMRQMLILKE
jgi:hypothetical protein